MTQVGPGFRSRRRPDGLLVAARPVPTAAADGVVAGSVAFWADWEVLMDRRIHVLAVGLALAMTSALAVGASALDAGAGDGARATVHRVTVPAAHFVPGDNTLDYNNMGYYLETTDGFGSFLAEIPYSYPGVSHIFVTRVEFLAFDNVSGSDVCVALSRSEPGTGTFTLMGQQCTVDSPDDPQIVVFNPTVRRVNAGQRAILALWLSCPAVMFYGVRVTYTTNP